MVEQYKCLVVGTPSPRLQTIETFSSLTKMLSSLFNVAALALVADVASAAAVSSASRVSDSKIAGSTTSDVFPPTGSK
ncbi:unnamed protein product [Aureobasidium vineae]|uniref:Uncharacterized protein n=1 Tax=Aureobasidium vineae TaxID=2773715 RepID=A0A9N8JDR5_9PEZI|nr:unnamed protein product [Aureobasidium vineae]